MRFLAIASILITTACSADPPAEPGAPAAPEGATAGPAGSVTRPAWDGTVVEMPWMDGKRPGPTARPGVVVPPKRAPEVP
jgi:hypothetical protein